LSETDNGLYNKTNLIGHKLVLITSVSEPVNINRPSSVEEYRSVRMILSNNFYSLVKIIDDNEQDWLDTKDKLCVF